MPCEAARTRSLLCAATIITAPGSPEPRNSIAEMYQSAIEFLGSGDPGAVMMVAAHNNDLVRAAEHGMKTAYIARPYEHGPKQARDFKAEHDFTYVATSFEDLATQLGA